MQSKYINKKNLKQDKNILKTEKYITNKNLPLRYDKEDRHKIKEQRNQDKNVKQVKSNHARLCTFCYFSLR